MLRFRICLVFSVWKSSFIFDSHDLGIAIVCNYFCRMLLPLDFPAVSSWLDSEYALAGMWQQWLHPPLCTISGDPWFQLFPALLVIHVDPLIEMISPGIVHYMVIIFFLKLVSTLCGDSLRLLKYIHLHHVFNLFLVCMCLVWIHGFSFYSMGYHPPLPLLGCLCCFWCDRREPFQRDFFHMSRHSLSIAFSLVQDVPGSSCNFLAARVMLPFLPSTLVTFSRNGFEKPSSEL